MIRKNRFNTQRSISEQFDNDYSVVKCTDVSAIAKHTWNVNRFHALIIVKYILLSCALKLLLRLLFKTLQTNY